jgi:probable rRNA maturation factor
MFEITNLNSNKIPFAKTFLKKVKEEIIGKKYDLSVVFLNNKESRRLNREHRNKNKSSNVLSFPILEPGDIDPESGKKSDGAGEIFVNIDAVSDASEFDVLAQKIGKRKMADQKYLLYLYIHGLLHLKGFDHGDKMEKQEEKFLKKFW